MKHDDSRLAGIDLTPVEEIAAHEYRWAAIFWSTVILSCIAAVAFADTVTYQSQTMIGTSTEIDGGINLGPQTDNDSYIVTLTLSGPLGPNLNMAAVTPQSWNVTCTACQAYLSSTPSNIPQGMMTATTSVFLFSTDSTGKITAWHFSISGSFMLIDANGDVLSLGYGNYASGDSATSQRSENGHQLNVAMTGVSGTWIQSSLSNPAPPPAPTPPPAPAPTANVQLMSCTNTWIAPINKAHTRIWPNANGTGAICDSPVLYPGSTWYAMATTNGGKSTSYVSLQSLGLGNGK